jgi:hypothetical protein
MILSSIIFALAHRFDDPLSWLELRFVGLLIGLFLLGCLLALVYYVTNSLACSIGAHSGLIWIALAKKTQIIQVAPSGWDISNSFDPRTGPAAWILFILLTILFWSLRRWLRKTFEIENLDLIAAAATSPQLEIDGSARPDFDHSVTRRDWLVAILGGVACLASFIAMQKLIEHKMSRDAETFHAAVDEFKTAVSRGASVAAAARAAGFQPAGYRYGVERATRLANGQVEIVGLAADMPGDGSPLVILVLAGNKTIFQGQSEGAREDFARMYALTDATKTYASFPISCP